MGSNTTDPRVSVLMPIHNALPYLREAVDSILAQTFGDFELILIDDGSTDGSTGLLESYAQRDARVVLLRRAHGGIVAALNDGLDAARGELIARMDGDDRSRPTRLAEQVAFLDAHPQVAAVGTDLLRIDDRGRPICTKGVETSHEAIERMMLAGRAGAMTHATTMVRRAAIDAAGGGYREQCRHAEDLDLFLRIAQVGELANLDRVLYDVRLHLGSVTRRESTRRLFEVKKQIIKEARRRRGLPAQPPAYAVPDREYSPAMHRLTWAWRALGALNKRTARHHAMRVLWARPWSARAWAVLVGSWLPPKMLGRLVARRRARRSSGDEAAGGVVIVTGRFPSVSETFVLSQVTGLMERGLDVRVYAMQRGEDACDGQMLGRVRYALRPPDHALARSMVAVTVALRRGPQGVRLLWATLDRERFGRRGRTLRPFFEALPLLDDPIRGVVIAQYGPLGVLMDELRALGLWRGGLITCFRGYDATRVPREAPGCYDRLFQRGEVFLASSGDLRRAVIALGCYEDKVRVLTPGVDLARFAPEGGGSRRSDEPVRLIAVGRLVEKKGFGVLIDALGQVMRSGRRFECRIVGDGPLRRALVEQVERVGLAGCVKLVGAQSHGAVLQLLRQSQVLVAPSVTASDGNREGIPNAIKEAMACGLAVVATEHGGIPDAVADGESGLLVGEYDAAALAGAIQTLIDDEPRRRAMGEAGRRIACERFDGEKRHDELAALVGAMLR